MLFWRVEVGSCSVCVAGKLRTVFSDHLHVVHVGRAVRLCRAGMGVIQNWEVQDVFWCHSLPGLEDRSVGVWMR